LITLSPVSADRLEDGRRMAEARAALVQSFLERHAPRKVEADEPEPAPMVEATTEYDPVQEEADAIAAINRVLRAMGEEEIAA
jgi:hypothetical protein